MNLFTETINLNGVKVVIIGEYHCGNCEIERGCCSWEPQYGFMVLQIFVILLNLFLLL